MGRRLMYYWNLLQKDDSELIRKVFNTQKLMPVKNDWVLQLQKDLNVKSYFLKKVLEV